MIGLGKLLGRSVRPLMGKEKQFEVTKVFDRGLRGKVFKTQGAALSAAIKTGEEISLASGGAYVVMKRTKVKGGSKVSWDNVLVGGGKKAGTGTAGNVLLAGLIFSGQAALAVGRIARWGLDKLLFIIGLVCFYEFILEEAIQTSNFGLFVAKDDVLSLHLALNNHYRVLQNLLNRRVLLWWNFNEMAYSGFFNAAVNTYTSYLMKFILLQSKISYIFDLTAKTEITEGIFEDVEASIYINDDFTFQYTPESDLVAKDLPFDAKIIKVGVRRRGYTDEDVYIEVDYPDRLKRVYADVDPLVLFDLDYNSVSQYLREGVMDGDFIKILINTPITNDEILSKVPEIKQSDIKVRVDPDTLLPVGENGLPASATNPAVVVKSWTGKVIEALNNYGLDPTPKVAFELAKEFTRLYASLGYTISKEAVNQLVRTHVGLLTEEERKTSLDLIIDALTEELIEKHSETIEEVRFRTIGDETDFESWNIGSYFHRNVRPFMYQTKEEVCEIPLEKRGKNRVGVLEEWFFADGTDSYTLKRMEANPSRLLVTRNRRIEELISPDDIVAVLLCGEDTIRWRVVTDETEGDWQTGNKITIDFLMKLLDAELLERVDETLIIETQVSGASVMWDGKYVGDTDSFGKIEIPIRYDTTGFGVWLTVYKEGYRNFSWKESITSKTPRRPYDTYTLGDKKRLFRINYNDFKMTTYIDYRIYPSINVKPNQSKIIFYESGTANKLEYFDNQPIIGLVVGTKYLLKVIAKGYDPFVKEFTYEGRLPIENNTVQLIKSNKQKKCTCSE